MRINVIFFYSQILENAKDIFYYLDVKKMRFEYFSPASQAITGYTPQELLSISLLDFKQMFHTDDVGVFESLDYHISNQTMPPKTLEFSQHRFKHKQGHYIWLNFHRSFILNGDSQLNAIVGCITDITQVKAEKEKLFQQLQESVESYKRLCDASFEGIVIHDDGKLVECNEQFAEMFGYTIDEIKQIDGYKLIHPERKDSIIDKIKQGYEGHYESINIRKDGSQIPVLIRAKNINIAGKNMRIAVFRDLTEQKHLERELIKSHEQYRDLYHKAQVGLFKTKISDGKTILCNQKMANILNYSSPEEVIKTFKSKDNYVDPKNRLQFISELKAKGSVNNAEICVYRKGGSKCWLHLSAKISEDGKHIEGAAFDVTAKKILTPTEIKVLEKLLEGRKNKAAALDLKISERTIEEHRRHIMRKFETDNFAELVRKAVIMGFEVKDLPL